jgi:hypothetical protein
LIRIHGLEVGSPELAIGYGLRGKQRRVRPPNSWFRRSLLFGVSADGHGHAGRRRFGFALAKLEFTRRRIARATGERDRDQDSAGGQQFWREPFQAGSMQPPRHKLATILSTKRYTGDRHDNYSVSKRAVVKPPIKMEFREKRGDHGQKI